VSTDVEFDAFLEQAEQQAAAMRAAVVTAGPDTEVPTTPGWTVRRLVAHIARVHGSVLLALDSDPDGPRPERPPRPPEEWEALLAHWDTRLADMMAELRRRGPDAPAWTFGRERTTGWWARRQAHELAIHRLDAEHAVHGDAVGHLVFDPEFAADGIDEAVTVMFRRRPIEVTGTVLYHAADAGRAWLVTATAGAPPVVGPATELATDASVVGTADAVYRAVWGRPSTAVVGGDEKLAAGLRTP
jgi:uncharacterized protein (TIGR03083 family)